MSLAELIVGCVTIIALVAIVFGRADVAHKTITSLVDLIKPVFREPPKGFTEKEGQEKEKTSVAEPSTLE